MMGRKRYIQMGVCLLVLVGLTSCRSYKRNYTGPLREKDQVAFLFYDSSFYGSFDMISEDAAWKEDTEIEIIKGRREMDNLGLGLRCLETLPGYGYLQVWKYRGYDDETQVSKDVGPFKVYFQAVAGHLYFLHCPLKFEEGKIWFIPFPRQVWEVNLEDVTCCERFQKYLEEMKRE